MCAKVLAFLTLATLTTLVRGNDLIVGLKTDGNKFFDENRQANPALWRQMDNVTIIAPENEIIRRVVITDLRPDKDGDVKVVEGGEGQKNVTIELKSPTVLRGYEFHIEVYSTPEEQIPFTNDQQSTTEIVQDDSTTAISKDPASKSDLSTDKINPAILSNDEEIKDNERQGRNAKNYDKITTEGTTELTSTTINSDVSTTPTTLNAESTTENRNDKNSDTANKFEKAFIIPPIPLNKNFNINPAIPAVTGRNIASKTVSGDDETRHVRDTEKEKSDKTTETNPIKVRFESSTINDKDATTTKISDSIPVEDNFEGNTKDIKSTTVENRKYTSIISSKDEHPGSPDDVKAVDKLRNVRGANEEQKFDEGVSTTTAPGESTTTNISDETTLSSDDCMTTKGTEAQNPVNTGKDNKEDKPGEINRFLNNRQWNQRFNNPTFQTDQKSPDIKVYPAILTSDQSTLAPETVDAERLGNDYRPSPDHLENRNPKFRAISGN